MTLINTLLKVAFTEENSLLPDRKQSHNGKNIGFFLHAEHIWAQLG